MALVLSEAELKDAGIDPDMQRRWRSFFNTEGGQIILREIYDVCGLARISHTPGDPMTTAYLDGRRSFAVWLFNVMGAKLQDLEEDAITAWVMEETKEPEHD